jgi:hypothetical protein
VLEPWIAPQVVEVVGVLVAAGDGEHADLRCTDGSENGGRVSSTMAGVAASDSAEIGFDTQISASNQLLTLHPPANP